MENGLRRNHSADVCCTMLMSNNCISISAAIECGTLDSPDNGIVRVTGTTVGSFAKYTCNPGFKLSGSDMRTCQATGEWSGSAPVCRCKSKNSQINWFIFW